jgi:hypothetical protein
MTQVESVARASATSMIALADPRYDESLIFAESLQRQGAKVIPFASDLAGRWFDAIEPGLRGGRRGLTGLTLESDLFILERLAEGLSVRTRYVGLHDWRCRQGSAHTLSGSIDLDPIAAALVKGKDQWAASLGEALGLAKEDGQKERSLAFDCAMQTGHGPRFFVSWLMRRTA